MAKHMKKLKLRVIVLAIVLFFSYLTSSLAVGLPLQINHGLALLTVSLLNAAVVSNFVASAKWSGIRLILALFAIYYCITTFLTQIETIVFLEYFADIIPATYIPKLFIQGIIVALIFSISAVLIHGKLKNNQADFSVENKTLVGMSFVSMLYVILYFSFGMFVFMPLAGNSFYEYYGNLQLPMWIIPLQIFRGFIWAGLALIVVKAVDSKHELTTALLFSVLMASLLLMPNEFMPDRIRFAHFVEIATSNFILGWVAVRILKYF
ncbi:hypothetical protein DRP05_05425 [Archaeoglobales archaeon]|nr:MAG: hypothetical protein DRP05_05425 [Archaeoglobales archaeon]